jgi:hypothetical protein
VSATAGDTTAGRQAAVAAASRGPIRQTFEELKGVCSRHPGLTVAVIASVWASILTMGLILHLNADIYGEPGDATGTIADYAWWGYALTHGKSLFENPYGAPFGAGYENVVFSALQVAVSAPLSAVLGPVVTYNLEVLSGFPLTAWVTFLLGRQLRLPPLAAAFSALALTFMPYHLQKAMGHLGMVHMELFSATLLFLLRWRDTGRRRNLALAGVVAGLALCLDPYDAFIAAVLIAAFFVVSLALASPLLPGIWRRLREHTLAAVIGVASAALFAPVALVAAHRPTGSGAYLQGVAAGAQGVAHLRAETITFSARPIEFVQPWFANPLVPEWLRQSELSNLPGNVAENTLFLGYTVMVLAIVGTLLIRRAVFPVVISWAVGLAGFVFSAPPFLYRLPAGITISAPSYYLYSLLPYFRVYARFGVLVMLGVVLLAGLGLAGLASRVRAGWPRAFLVVPFLLLAVEFNNLPPLHTTRLFPAPPAYEWLAAQPPGILIEYPLHAGSDANVQQIQTYQYELYQQTHQHPIFNGSSPTSRAGQMEPQLEPYYRPGVATRLGALGIRYVFVLRNEYRDDGLQLPHQVPGLRFVQTIAGIDVYEVASG